MPVPPTIHPSTSYTNSTTGKQIDFYELTVRPFTKQIYPNLNATVMVGYNGIYPGPTFKVLQGTQSLVRVVNDKSSPNPASVHLHGSYSRAPFDGWADDMIMPGMYKDYYYPNAQAARTMWYHDHSFGSTAKNVFAGQAGLYTVLDPKFDHEKGLPVDDYDIPLALSSRQFNPDGSLIEVGDTPLDGDVLMVNGQPWPFFNVEPRKYRFRLIDADITRNYFLYLVADDAPTVEIPFTVIATDGGYVSQTVTTPDLIISPGERYEIIIDFEPFKGKSITVMNRRAFLDNVDYPNTDKFLKFNVGDTVKNSDNNAPVPSTLAELDLPTSKTDVDHTFNFEFINNTWLINSVGFSDVRNRILAFPTRGEVQRWRLVNIDPGFAIVHPIHLHLVDFQILSRTGGRNALQSYETVGLKDMVMLATGETIEILAKFAPWAGIYMFHCHNLIHEDHDMMAAFNVSQIDLSSFGYPDNITFTDPMSPDYLAKNLDQPTDLMTIQKNTLPNFQALGAYPDDEGVRKALRAAIGIRKSKSSASSSNVLRPLVHHSFLYALVCLGMGIFPF
ncbi:Bilirubin oxidase [Podosphaera aphanis]|nr:Bilirubin oxidase [Podosphaera aphanis]